MFLLKNTRGMQVGSITVTESHTRLGVLSLNANVLPMDKDLVNNPKIHRGILLSNETI